MASVLGSGSGQGRSKLKRRRRRRSKRKGTTFLSLFFPTLVHVVLLYSPLLYAEEARTLTRQRSAPRRAAPLPLRRSRGKAQRHLRNCNGNIFKCGTVSLPVKVQLKPPFKMRLLCLHTEDREIEPRLCLKTACFTPNICLLLLFVSVSSVISFRGLLLSTCL